MGQYSTVMGGGGGCGMTPEGGTTGCQQQVDKDMPERRRPAVCFRSLRTFLEGSPLRGTTNPSRILESSQCCGAAPVVRWKHHPSSMELLGKLIDDKSLLSKGFASH